MKQASKIFKKEYFKSFLIFWSRVETHLLFAHFDAFLFTNICTLFVLIGLAPTRAVDTKISLCPNHFSCLLFKICTFEISRVTKKEQQSYIFLD
jgi:hypothetical protein